MSWRTSHFRMNRTHLIQLPDQELCTAGVRPAPLRAIARDGWFQNMSHCTHETSENTHLISKILQIRSTLLVLVELVREVANNCHAAALDMLPTSRLVLLPFSTRLLNLLYINAERDQGRKQYHPTLYYVPATKPKMSPFTLTWMQP